MSESRPREGFPKRAASELKEFIILTCYLYVTLGAVIVMKTAVLHSHGIHSALWGVAIVKALLLAKFMMIGRAMNVGEGRSTGPLIWPTLRRAFAFLILLVVLIIIEQGVVGLFHHRSVGASLGELVGPRLEETAANILIMLLVLVPYFAFRVLDEALGVGTLKQMFFRNHERAALVQGSPRPDQTTVPLASHHKP